MYSLAVGSVTNAARAKDILKRNGVNSGIQRYSGERRIGCGYVVTVRDEADKCIKLLKEAGINVLDVSKR